MMVFPSGYQHPPPAVHHVMMASLLLLGHWEEETEVTAALSFGLVQCTGDGAIGCL